MKCHTCFLFTLLIASAVYCAGLPPLAAQTADAAPSAGGALPQQLQVLEPELTELISKTETEIAIRSDKHHAVVSLNGVYQGLTPLTVTGLAAGTYTLSVSRQGYRETRVLITVNKGENREFYVMLKPVAGSVTVTGAPENSWYYLDETKQESPSFEAAEGKHRITVRSFGYDDFSATVTVAADGTTEFPVTLVPASFSLSSLRASLKEFNPADEQGKVVVAFSVTAPETGTFSVSDGAGAVVYSADLPLFDTWNQQVVWNGCDDSGSDCADGAYTVSVTAGGISRMTKIRIDHSLSRAPFFWTPSGTGIGSLPAAYKLPEGISFVSVSASPVFRTQAKPFSGAPFSLAFGSVPLSWLECTAYVTAHLGTDSTPAGGGASVKCSGFVPVGENRLCFSALVRYGFLTSSAPSAPYGADTGNGVGCGIAAGFDSRKWYGGFSSEYIFSAADGLFAVRDSVWRNGVAVRFVPTPLLSFSSWCALNSAVGLYDSAAASVGSQIIWFRAVDSGAGASVLLGGTPVALLLNLRALSYIGGITCFSGTFGFMYLF